MELLSPYRGAYLTNPSPARTTFRIQQTIAAHQSINVGDLLRLSFCNKKPFAKLHLPLRKQNLTTSLDGIFLSFLKRHTYRTIHWLHPKSENDSIVDSNKGAGWKIGRHIKRSLQNRTITILYLCSELDPLDPKHQKTCTKLMPNFIEKVSDEMRKISHEVTFGHAQSQLFFPFFLGEKVLLCWKVEIVLTLSKLGGSLHEQFSQEPFRGKFSRWKFCLMMNQTQTLYSNNSGWFPQFGRH